MQHQSLKTACNISQISDPSVSPLNSYKIYVIYVDRFIETIYVDRFIKSILIPCILL